MTVDVDRYTHCSEVIISLYVNVSLMKQEVGKTQECLSTFNPLG